TNELRQQLAKKSKCFYCRKPGHRASDCELAKKSPTHRPKPASRATRIEDSTPEPEPEPVPEAEVTPPPSPEPVVVVPEETRYAIKTVPPLMKPNWDFNLHD